MLFPAVIIKTMPCYSDVTVVVSYLLTENISFYEIIATNWSNLLFLAWILKSYVQQNIRILFLMFAFYY